MPLRSLAAHLNECEFNSISCPKDCGFEGRRRELREHDCNKYLKGLLSRQTNPESSSLAMSKAEIDKLAIAELNKIGSWFLDSFDARNARAVPIPSYEETKRIMHYYSPIVARIKEICLGRDIECFDENKHRIDTRIRISRGLMDFVPVEPNCRGYYNSTSIALFGDECACAALVLLLVATLIEFENEFKALCGSKPAFQKLVRDALRADINYFNHHYWLALSAALRKPVFLYNVNVVNRIGIFNNDWSYRFAGFEEDDGYSDSAKPICICYDTSIRYCNTLMPKKENVKKTLEVIKLGRPKNRPLEYLVPKRH